MATRLLHLREVLSRTSLSRSTVYRLMALGEGSFPQAVKLGARTSWVESEVQDWIDARIAERAAA